MSKSEISIENPCRLEAPGHSVFWLKALRLMERDRATCRVRVLDEECVLLELGETKRLMFLHDAKKLEADLSRPDVSAILYVEAAGYLYVNHENASSSVFSLSERVLEKCPRPRASLSVESA